MADVLGRTVHRMEEPQSANLRGAAALALLGLGELTVADLHGRAPVAEEHRPQAATRAVYDDLFTAFRGSYRAARRVRGRLAAVREDAGP
jgi:sugar (pentulose or hexulose) kinase